MGGATESGQSGIGKTITKNTFAARTQKKNSEYPEREAADALYLPEAVDRRR
jgi:hypothetical protein